MKRVRKYTYLPQEEIEVIETKSGQTIKSKEILDGNYVKAKPAPKKVVKKAVKKKYAKGGKLVGNQKKLDVNKNGKLDAEDFKMLRGEKMADGGIIVKDWELKSNGRYYATFFLMKDDPRYRLITEHGVTESIEDVNGGYELTISVTKEGKDFFENYEGLDTNGNPYTFKTMAKGGKTPIVRTQFEEEEFEYAKGGEMIPNPKGSYVPIRNQGIWGVQKRVNGEFETFFAVENKNGFDISNDLSKKVNENNEKATFSFWVKDGINAENFISKYLKGYEIEEDEDNRVNVFDLEIVFGKFLSNKSQVKDYIIESEDEYAKGGKVGKVYKLVPMKPYGVKGMITADYEKMESFSGTEDDAVARAKEMAASNPNFVRVEVKLPLKTKTNTIAIVDGQNKEFADGGMMANVPSQIPSRIVRNAAKAAKEENRDVKIYYSTKYKQFHYSMFRAINYNDVLVGVVSPSGEVKNDDNFFYNQEDYNNYISRRDEVLEQTKLEQTNKMADGGKVTDKEVAESNVEMLHSNIKSIKHHAEELEHAIKDNTEVEGWVLAKADRAATAMSDITHYLDGRKMGRGGMVAGHYYKDKAGSDLRYIGPDSKNDDLGIFKDGEKYLTKPFGEFAEEKEKKSFWFGNGGFMPSGFSRKVTLSEKAEEMVGKNTWHILDAAQKGEVIGELISDGALAVTMDRGGIVDADDWSKSMTQDKIYALKKAGYSENIASEMSLLPYEQLPMWVREDFKKGSIIIGKFHIHKAPLSFNTYSDDKIPTDGKILVLDDDDEVVFYADTLEEAKDWAYREIQDQKEMDDEFVDEDERVGERDYADGGVTEATKFKVVYKLRDAAEPKEKLFDNAENAEFFLETIKEDDDIMSANLVEVKPMKKAAEKKAPTNLFAAAKPAAASSASKKTKEDVLVPGIADRIARYDALKAIIKNAEAEKEVIGGTLKEVGKEKFLELYELRRRNPETFNLADEDEKIMFIVMDKYIKVEPEKAGMLENYPGLLETTTTYKFNPALLDKTGEIVSRLILESTELSDDEKANLIVAETKIGIKSGSIDRLMDYDNPSQIFDLIEPILALK